MFYPRVALPGSGDDDLEWVPASGLGTVYSITVNRARKQALAPSAVLAGLGGLACLAPSPFAALAVVSVALFGHLSWATNIHTVITEIAPARHLAVLYGITGAAGTLLGALTQPLIGLVVDRSGHGPVFAGAGAAYVVALLLLGLGGRIGGGDTTPPDAAVRHA